MKVAANDWGFVRTGETIHFEESCSAAQRATHRYNWLWANGKTKEEILAVPWLKFCKKCFPQTARKCGSFRDIVVDVSARGEKGHAVAEREDRGVLTNLNAVTGAAPKLGGSQKGARDERVWRSEPTV